MVTQLYILDNCLRITTLGSYYLSCNTLNFIYLLTEFHKGCYKLDLYQCQCICLSKWDAFLFLFRGDSDISNKHTIIYVLLYISLNNCHCHGEGSHSRVAAHQRTSSAGHLFSGAGATRLWPHIDWRKGLHALWVDRISGNDRGIFN